MEARVWWSPPGSEDVYTLEPSCSGTSCFRFTPFSISDKHPSIEMKGHVIHSAPPARGTIAVTTPFDRFSTAQNDHMNAVSKAIDLIENGVLDKVVVARIKSVTSDASPEATFKLKCEKHPDAFVYLIDHPSCGVWCGATPELLIASSDNRVETVSLAGTRVLLKGDATNDWTAKEKHEQAQVTEYIQSVLENYGASEMSIEPRADRKYGNLIHLETRFRCSIKGDIQHLASTLHPTPAVGGRPLKEACDFIALHEQFSRAYYSGYLGVETASGSAYYVNLRAAQWMVGGIRIYAGGGIVEGSIPQDEWLETEAKIKAIEATFA
tara:strand:- start:9044 stop:10015 length:972 start_codon:yes stop_codon:yes gene_type:complete